MTLKQWARIQGLTVTGLARMLNRDKSTVSRILTGKTAHPSPETARAIIELTNGAVTLGDIYGNSMGKKKK